MHSQVSISESRSIIPQYLFLSQPVLDGNRLVVSEQRGVKKLQEEKEFLWTFVLFLLVITT